ncbi:Protein of unknown function [Pyronema omphalodes CBS 100304]|uniref:Uncharacterized protein n=1 Tax=Pyronema omphalodes (strain CBS 100304) TaxID=1076935 RepID=U4L9X8_PYROM|nr:Protein of unknown function [Pyronema omphalodes CBS 100304]
MKQSTLQIRQLTPEWRTKFLSHSSCKRIMWHHTETIYLFFGTSK